MELDWWRKAQTKIWWKYWRGSLNSKALDTQFSDTGEGWGQLPKNWCTGTFLGHLCWDTASGYIGLSLGAQPWGAAHLNVTDVLVYHASWLAVKSIWCKEKQYIVTLRKGQPFVICTVGNLRTNPVRDCRTGNQGAACPVSYSLECLETGWGCQKSGPQTRKREHQSQESSVLKENPYHEHGHQTQQREA